jgi:TfoX/Sxy family transcriptional regulator of competence genes
LGVEVCSVAWEKSPEALVERFGHVLDRFPEAQRRKMFGYPAAFIGGNMVTGLHQQDWVVRLSEEDQRAARAAGAETFEPMAGRPMKAFVKLPSVVLEDDEALADWVGRAVANGRSMPPKR